MHAMISDRFPCFRKVSSSLLASFSASAEPRWPARALGPGLPVARHSCLSHSRLLAAPRMQWRRSKAFETLSIRALYLIGVATFGGLGMIIWLKKNGDFGTCNLTPRTAHASAHGSLPLSCARACHRRAATVAADRLQAHRRWRAAVLACGLARRRPMTMAIDGDT